MHETLNLQETQKHTFKKIFLFIANELFGLSAENCGRVVRKSWIAVPDSSDRQGQ